ncbi:MAG TPA: PA0069 family radical SAM protein [Chitinophagaceae bacterium]|nr:PA0069 family radical SAM protein [Chitinophagaceae bacterium]HNF70850.1 PA0069 family radical SAM protein [Chitinophagaceae bacterium]
MKESKKSQKGRGALINPANRFLATEYAIEHPEAIDDWERESTGTQFYEEHGKTIVNKVKSPDIPIAWSLNPYQGCEHGCVYCYARNSHEYWGFSAGVDFESRIVVKRQAPQLLRELLSSRKWKGEAISLSGNTDCYQPIERKLKITRQLLEVCLQYRNAVGIITKNALVLRDLDLLTELNRHQLVMVYVSITSTNELLRRKLEPRTSTYEERFRILETLAKAGIPCGVMNAPVIPGLNDADMYDVLRKASLAGAKQAGYTMVRLNGAVSDLFRSWLKEYFPDRMDKVLNLISGAHGGQLNDHRFGVRMKGEGTLAELIEQQFRLYCRQFHLNEEKFSPDTSLYRREVQGQLSLF